MPPIPVELSEATANLAAVYADYRVGDSGPLTPGRALAWAMQFEEAERLIVVREATHVLGKCYVSKDRLRKFLAVVANEKDMVGTAGPAFWRKVGLLRLQNQGRSQADMIELLAAEVKTKHGVDLDGAESQNGHYLFLDDVMFSGGRVHRPLVDWINSHSLTGITIWIVVFAWHGRGKWWANKQIVEACRGRNVTIRWKHVHEFDDWRKPEEEDASLMLWPSRMPDHPDVAAWLSARPNDLKHASLRAKPTAGRLFSSPEARDILEGALIRVGARWCQNSSGKTTFHPLGYNTLNGFGFGTMVTTYRNCPNNAPLALWWSDDTWLPLLERRLWTQDPATYGFDIWEEE